MRKFLAIIVVVGAALALTPNARAQIPVIDAANLAQNVQELAQDVATVDQLKSQLLQLQQTYAMFTNPTNIMGMATNLENQAVENPMPAANILATLLGGQTTPTGTGANYYNQNHIYTATRTAPYNTQVTANAQGIANIEGVAANNLSAIQTRLQELPNLENDLNSASSITQVDAINGRIAAESQFVQAQQAQATNLQVLANAQQQSQMQQGQEIFQQEESQAPAQLAAVDGNN
jgi:hypothetical protein